MIDTLSALRRSDADAGAGAVVAGADSDFPLDDAPEAAPEFHAYNPDGSVDIPGDLAAQLDNAAPRADFIPLKVVPSAMLNPRRPLKVRPNHFAQSWNGTDGMPLHEAMWRSVTLTKEFVAPWGGHYGCAWILILVACADIPPSADIGQPRILIRR